MSDDEIEMPRGTASSPDRPAASNSARVHQRASGVRSTGTPRTSRVAATDRPVNLCPRCYIALPATGICDTCD